MRQGLFLLVAGTAVLVPAAAQEPARHGPDRQREIRAKATLQGHTDIMLTLTFSPDGTTLASGGHDATIKLWDLAALAGPAQ
ncbi:MAG TPA: WD40 repeat domain-containing protein [Gemmataceae bacterium]|nr:WD40 repeat domain-containing protein [Gemmataceae bacterium]